MEANARVINNLNISRISTRYERRNIMELVDNKYCFACGRDNPIGLKLKFTPTEDGLAGEFIPEKEHQGFKDIVHGGIISTLLDEAMAWLCIHKGLFGITAKIETKFKKPALVGEKLKITADIIEIKGKIINTQAKILNSKKEIIAEGKGTFICFKKQ